MPVHPVAAALLASLLAPVVVAQDPVAPAGAALESIRLSERVPAPLVLLSSIAPTERAMSESAARSLAADASARKLLACIGLDGASLDEVLELVAMSTGEFEIALLGVAREAGQLPALIGRFRLDAQRAASIDATLRLGTLTTPSGMIGAQQIHVMRSRVGTDAAAEHAPTAGVRDAGDASGSAARSAMPRGEFARFELTLIGQDLLVSNDRSSLQSSLEPEEGSALARTAVAADPGFRSLLQRLTLDPGSVAIVFAWDRLVAELLARGDESRGLMLRALRLDRATHIALESRRLDAHLLTTMLVGFADPRSLDVAGIFRIVREESLRSLVAALPVAGSGGLALGVDLTRSGALGGRNSGSGVTHGDPVGTRPLATHFEEFGSCASAFGFHVDLGIGRDAVDEFAGLCTMQCVAADGGGAAVAIGLRTKQRATAAALFEQYAAGMTAASHGGASALAELVDLPSGGRALRFGGGRIVGGQTAGGMSAAGDSFGGAFTASDADLLFAADPAALDALARADQELGRRANARRQAIRRALGRLSIDRAAGVFCMACVDRPDRFHAGALRIEQQGVRLDMVTPL